MIRIEAIEVERLALIKYGDHWRIKLADACHVNLSTVWRWRQEGMPVKYKGALE